MFQRIREAGFRVLSFLNKNDDQRADINDPVEESLAADLDPYLARQVRRLNEQHSAARVVPLRRAS